MDGAATYVLEVSELRPLRRPEPLLVEEVPGSARSWTPSLDRCLARGGRYAWSVRAIGEDWSGPQSPTAVFEVAPAFIEAPGGATESGSIFPSTVPPGQDAFRSGGGSSLSPASRSAANVSGYAIVVEGVGVQVLPESPCWSGDSSLRFVSCGNGTVQDVATGLLWLQSAACVGPMSWWDASALAASLKDGDCGLADGSQPGAWRLPTREEFESILRPLCFPTVVGADGLGCWADSGNSWTLGLQPRYWGRGSIRSAPQRARGFDAGAGETASFDKDDSLHFWAVRPRERSFGSPR